MQAYLSGLFLAKYDDNKTYPASVFYTAKYLMSLNPPEDRPLAHHPIFFSLVLVLRNQAHRLEHILQETSRQLTSLASDWELIVVDNASDDSSIDVLKAMTGEGGLPNIQVFALTKEVDNDTAAWAGLENALGDFIGVIDPAVDDTAFVAEMLRKAVEGADVVFAKNESTPPQSLPYSIAYATFNRVFKWLSGVDLANEAPQYRILSKRIVNYLLQHAQPAVAYRHIPATAGFSKVHLLYTATPREQKAKRIFESLGRGARLLVSTTTTPMRIVTSLTLFGAGANVAYSIYVVTVGLLASNVQPGWISLSLQQSGMFFLISLVLLVLGEYILHMASAASDAPPYHVGQELTSTHMTRRDKLNIAEHDPLTLLRQTEDKQS